jgi:hypothetical protein
LYLRNEYNKFSVVEKLIDQKYFKIILEKKLKEMEKKKLQSLKKVNFVHIDNFDNDFL